jgi:quercetin dioxygenase-like cupin family protein
MEEDKLFQIEAEIIWENLGKGISRQIYGYDDKVMMVKVKFEEGAIGTLHQHQNAQVTYVESGVFEVTINEYQKTLLKGDGFYAPPHKIHGVICKQKGVLIDVFSPQREDFL